MGSVLRSDPPKRCEGLGQGLPPTLNVAPSTPGLFRPEGPVPPPRSPGKGPAQGSRTAAPPSPAAGPGQAEPSRAGPGPQGCGRRVRCVAPVTAPTGAAIFPPRPPAASPATPATHCAGAGPSHASRDDGAGTGRCCGAMMGRSNLRSAGAATFGRSRRHLGRGARATPPCWGGRR